MSQIVNIINGIFSFLFTPLQRLEPVWGLTIISVLIGIAVLFVFRYTSNQRAIKISRNRIKAHILELLYYKDSIRVMVKALLRILWQNTIYLRYALVPLIIIIVPMILLFIQLDFRYQYRPLKTGETSIVKMRLSETPGNSARINILPSDAIEVETPALRMDHNREFNWRIRAKKAGLHHISFSMPGGGRIEKTIEIADHHTGLMPLSPRKVRGHFWDVLFNPVEKPLPSENAVESVELMYPHRPLRIFGIRLNWLLFFFIATIIFT